jgi:hypothetical protein
MIIDSPVPFKEALQSRAVKKLFPTGMSSADLEKLPVAFREQAMFSARTMNGQYLQEIADRVRTILNPTTETRADGTQFTEGMDFATARTELKDVLKSMGYAAEPGEEGTIKDLSSDARLDLVLDTNVKMAQGYGYWQQGQDPDVLEVYPAQELFRAEARKEERDWGITANGRWCTAARAVGDEAALRCWSEHNGRMVARKDSPIWVALSRFGQPYPPFDFNSGMDIRDVDRETAVELGVIGENDRVQPQSREFAQAA